MDLAALVFVRLDWFELTWFLFIHSFNASEQQCGQQSLLSVCEVPGHTGTEVSVEHQMHNIDVYITGL